MTTEHITQERARSIMGTSRGRIVDASCYGDLQATPARLRRLIPRMGWVMVNRDGNLRLYGSAVGDRYLVWERK